MPCYADAADAMPMLMLITLALLMLFTPRRHVFFFFRHIFFVDFVISPLLPC